MRLVEAPDVLAAEQLLHGVVHVTPLQRSASLSALVGGPVYLKCENLQRAGSFKIRGAYVRMSRLSEAERAAGVVAASAGNHAQGVALAARLLGISAQVFMPHGAPLPKVQATRGYGATVQFAGHTIDEALQAARQHASQTSAVLVHPFDHRDIVAGQGSVGLEILRQCPQVRTVVVPTGGGGLLAGIATALAGHEPPVRVVGVQADGAAAYPASIAAGRPVPLERMVTMADGIAVGCPGEVPYAVVRARVPDVLTVTEEELSQALLHLLERAKQVVEPAGAAGVAALMSGAITAPALEPPVVVVLSGGNVDPLLLLRVIRHGMAAAGRYLQVTVRVVDRPGSLATLLALLADATANVLEVEHVRTNPDTPVDEVEIALRLETQGPDHCEQVVAAMAAAGYRLVG